MIWTLLEPINKFGDLHVHFKSLGTRMTLVVMFRAASAFYSYYFNIQHGYNHTSDAFIRFNPSVFNQQVVQKWLPQQRAKISAVYYLGLLQRKATSLATRLACSFRADGEGKIKEREDQLATNSSPVDLQR